MRSGSLLTHIPIKYAFCENNNHCSGSTSIVIPRLMKWARKCLRTRSNVFAVAHHSSKQVMRLNASLRKQEKEDKYMLNLGHHISNSNCRLRKTIQHPAFRNSFCFLRHKPSCKVAINHLSGNEAF